jgi:ElaB/YqjD/DUF883 family membrane-anchored ribosome-binding protein
MSGITSSLDEKASKLAERVSDFGHEAADIVDHARNETAGGLHAAASSIRRNVREGARVVENLAESTAATLDEAGSYLKKHDLKRTLGDSRQLVRRYPGESLALAAGVGFLAGIAIRRLTHTCARSSARAAA